MTRLDWKEVEYGDWAAFDEERHVADVTMIHRMDWRVILYKATEPVLHAVVVDMRSLGEATAYVEGWAEAEAFYGSLIGITRRGK